MNIPESLSLLYFPIAVALGALHALEPGHAKTLTAAYLIGVKGTKKDAVLLGLSVAATHSLVVVLISVLALWLGREAFTDQATHFLQIASGVIVIILGSWLFWKRWRIIQRVDALRAGKAETDSHSHDHHNHPEHRHDDSHSHPHDRSHSHGHHEHSHSHGHHHRHQNHEHDQSPHEHHDHEEGVEHDHDLMTDEEHARAHAAQLPEYVKRGERPTIGQVMAFGAAGGLIPCPASITVMLLALSVGETGRGLLLLLGFSLGLAAALVGVGLLVVVGLTKLAAGGRFSWFTARAPLFSAALVIFSGIAALLFVH